jgi:hypothetical protein
MRKAMVLGVFLLAGTLASPAFADEFSGFRLGIDLSSESLEGDMFFDPAGTESLDIKRFGYGLSGGWALNKYLAFEAAYRHGSEFNSRPFEELTGPNGYFKSHIDLRGFEGSVVGSYWLNRKIGVFGRAGIFAYQQEESFAVVDLTTDPISVARAEANDSGFEPVFGVGLQTELDGALIRLEYKMGEIGDNVVIDEGDPDDPDDDFEIFSLRDQETSSLTLSIVWILH